MANKNRLFLLDAYALIFRGYYAFIKNPRINSKGLDTSAILGFMNSLIDVIKRESPDHLAVAFDRGGSELRLELFPEYKANRDETPEAIKIAVPYIKQILEAMHIPIVEVSGFEADDLIGTLAKQAEKENFEVYMVTPDKDYAQLVSENIFMYRPARMGNGIEIWGVDQVKEKFEVEYPEQVIDFLGMMGDAVDNIPGLPGVGEKTAKKFIKEYGTMENLLVVVVEAVHAKMEETGQDAKEASVNTMGEISGAIVSITLVMSAVFIPVTFIPGPTGVFYKQFGITLIVSILISAVNALTLSPALCALFLKQHDHHEGKKRNFVQRFFDAFNVAFNKLTHKYGNSFKFLLRHKWLTFVILIGCLVLTFFFNKTMPSGFVPNEDRGFIMGNIELPAGASQDRVTSLQKEFSKIVQTFPGVEGVTVVSGFSFINGQGSNYGMAMIKLKDFAERTTPDVATDAIIGKLFGLAATQFQDARMIFFQPPSIPGFGMSSGFEMKLLDKTGGSLTDFDQKSKEYLGALMQRPEIMYAQSSFNTNYAQYELELNIPRAKESGVLVSDIFSALQGYIGGIYAADFTRFGKQYRVMVQSLPEYRSDVNSLNEIYVRTASGQMAPVTQFVNLKKVYGPQSVNRYNLFTSSNIAGAPKPGYSSGDAIKAVQEVAAQTLSSDYGIDFTGLSREEISSGSQTVMIFALCVIFVYFLLSAQYESYLLPFAVILSLPTGIMGAFLAQKYAGLENNIYFQIALVMLVGLLAKNAILIVEFALQRRQHGESIAESAINGAKARLRPILMTSFAFILGMMPLVFAKGVGDIGNRSIGTGAAFGLLIGTVLGVFVIPVLYAIFQYLQEKIKPIKFVEHKQE